MKTVTIFVAFDGTRFDTAEACRAHEAQHVETRLVGLTIEQVRSALSREDVELADAIEEIGIRINRIRRESGDLRRARKNSGDSDSIANTPERLAESKGREAFRSGSERVAPEDLDESLHSSWMSGFDYEKILKAA